MPVFTANIIIYTGTDFAQTFVLEDSATNSVKDLTGYVGCSQIKRYETSTKSADFTVTFANDRSTGRVSIEMLSTVTETLKAGKYFYDLIISSPEGVTERVIEGTAIVKKAVTR
tara:strand:+ start:1442 stop:1783 length:342 start_codon:yes stop_codon:yes gene_type:complete